MARKAVPFRGEEVDIAWLLERASEFGFMKSFDSVEDGAVAIFTEPALRSDTYNWILEVAGALGDKEPSVFCRPRNRWGLLESKVCRFLQNIK